MPATVFIDPIDTSNWTLDRQRNCQAYTPIIKAHLTRQMRNIPACDLFYDAVRTATATATILCEGT